MSYGIKISVIFAGTLLLFLPFFVFAQSKNAEQKARRDLSNYASIIAGYELDERCQVLNSRQRSEYRTHIRVIRHGFEQKGLPPDILDQIEGNARSTSRHQFSSCDRNVAELVERLGALTASLGERMAIWIAKTQHTRSKD